MIKKIIIIYFSVVSVLLPIMAKAYELATHARITEKAYEQSILQIEPQFIQELGIKPNLNSFGKIYYDISGSEVGERREHDFERLLMSNPEERLTIKGWLMRGAIREDDCYILILCKNPFLDGDPVGATRPLNHFYDPVYNRGLDASILPSEEKAPNWAFGTYDFTTSPIQDNRFINHYSLFDAQDAMYRALTGHDKNGNTAIGAGNEIVATKTIRQAYWATTFRALGDVVHLMQDMAQPQHTSNILRMIS